MIPGATPIKVFFSHSWGVQGMAYEDDYIQTTTYTHAGWQTFCTHIHTRIQPHTLRTHTRTFAHAFSARCREHIAGSSALLIKVW